MSAHPDALVPIEVAASRFNFPVSLLQLWIDTGKIKSAMLNGAILLYEADLMADLPKHERPEYIKHAHLHGVGIGLREAGRKYQIHPDTLSGWVQAGYIKKLGMGGVKKVLLDEADVAYAAEVYHSNPGKAGRRIFNPDGTPYRKI
jgi:predicted site-specific integrase-resolvase